MYTGSASVKPDVQVKRWHVQRTSWMREEYDEWKGGGGEVPALNSNHSKNLKLVNFKSCTETPTSLGEIESGTVVLK